MSTQEYVRLLKCNDCLTLEKIPDFPPNGDPRGDVLLERVLRERHRFPNGEPHKGQLFRALAADLENLDARTEITKEIFGLEYERAQWKDQFTEDAGKCFNTHGRPDRCADYKDPSKLLSTPTEQNPHAAQVYLCSFCPIGSMNESRFHENMLYRKEKLSKRKNRGTKGIVR